MAVEEETEYPKRDWIANPKGIPEIYSNYIHTSWSLFDVRILLGQLKPVLGESMDFKVEEQGAVFLSWGQTKNLVRLLSGMVQAYESVNGEIPKLNLAPRYEDIKKNEG
ncbi:MAG TPA: DUF3467 domain-containing protein [Acidobacteriaceae bacterium]|nr:DUF3467 domain-containing protein [Acidobacteriaceae bacterium]